MRKKITMDIGERRAASLIKIARQKLLVLQSWIQNGLPVGADGNAPYFPQNATQFAEWSDDELALKAFSAPNWRRKIRHDESMASEKRQLKIDAAIAMEALRKIKDRKNKKSVSIVNLRAAKKSLEDLTRSLSSQLQALDIVVERGNVQIQRLEIRLEEANAKIADLTQELKKLKGLKLVGGNQR